jgi:hypothetical protein
MPEISKQNLVVYQGDFAVNQTHQMPSPIKQSVEAFEAAAARFATDAIKDADLRMRYQANISRISKQILEDVAAKRITVKEGMEFANQMRNNILNETRAVTSAQALAYAQHLKKEGLSQEVLLNDKSLKLFKKPFAKLSQIEKDKVFYAIIESAGRDRPKVTAGTKKMKIMGKVGLIVTAALAVHAIAIADNKTKETIKQGGVLAGGAAGGLLAGLAVTPICGPGMPICAVAVVLIGSIAGGMLGDFFVDSFDEELEEFSRWNIR